MLCFDLIFLKVHTKYFFIIIEKRINIQFQQYTVYDVK